MWNQSSCIENLNSGIPITKEKTHTMPSNYLHVKPGLYNCVCVCPYTN